MYWALDSMLSIARSISGIVLASRRCCWHCSPASQSRGKPPKIVGVLSELADQTARASSESTPTILAWLPSGAVQSDGNAYIATMGTSAVYINASGNVELLAKGNVGDYDSGCDLSRHANERCGLKRQKSAFQNAQACKRCLGRPLTSFNDFVIYYVNSSLWLKL